MMHETCFAIGYTVPCQHWSSKSDHGSTSEAVEKALSPGQPDVLIMFDDAAVLQISVGSVFEKKKVQVDVAGKLMRRDERKSDWFIRQGHAFLH